MAEGFSSVRSMWQQRAQSGVEEKPTGRPLARVGPSQPPQSPSATTSRPGTVDLLHSFGMSLQADYSGSLVIKSLVPGGPADLAGQIFPLDSLYEVNGTDVRGWTIERVAPLLEENRVGATLRLGVWRVGLEDMINVELERDSSRNRSMISP
ncbi:hypothetical protein T484DRAFT_1910880, partial [Baffinella frigidus]